MDPVTGATLGAGPNWNANPKEDINLPPMDTLHNYSCLRILETAAVQRGWASEVAAWQCWRTWQSQPYGQFLPADLLNKPPRV